MTKFAGWRCCSNNARHNQIPESPNLGGLRRGEDLPRLRAIPGDLRLQRIEPVEALLRPQALDQCNTQMLAVEIGREIEKMRFEPQILAADRRAPAEIRGAIAPDRVRAILDPGAHGINARGGPQVVDEGDIGGGKADGAAELVADIDAAVDLPGPAQQKRRLARPAGNEMLADLGRRINDAARARDRRHDLHIEAVLAALGLEQFGRAAALVAEDEIVADDDRLGAEARHQNLGDEILGAFLREGLIEMEREEEIDAERFEHQRFRAERRQAKGRQTRLKHGARMRLEGQHREGRGKLLGQGPRLGQHRLMTEMDTVEIPRGDDRAARVARRVGMAEDAHTPQLCVTSTVASPSITTASPTRHSVFKTTCFFSRRMSVTVARASTLSPGR